MNQEQKAYISLINESSEESIIIKKNRLGGNQPVGTHPSETSNNLYIIRDSPYSDK